MARKPKKSGYWHHKPSGQAYVRLDGKDHYLGEYNSPESRDRYGELIRGWTLQGNVDAVTFSVDELALHFLGFAQGHYRKHGQSTNEAQSIHAVLRLLIAFAGPQSVCDFTPRRFREFRDWLIEQPDRQIKNEARKLSRQFINKSM